MMSHHVHSFVSLVYRAQSSWIAFCLIPSDAQGAEHRFTRVDRRNVRGWGMYVTPSVLKPASTNRRKTSFQQQQRVIYRLKESRAVTYRLAEHGGHGCSPELGRVEAPHPLTTSRERPSGACHEHVKPTFADRAMGQLRSWLQEQGMRENTLVWYFSDNGSPAEGAVTLPLRGRKGQMYEGGIRVPAVLEWPQRISQPRGTAVNVVTSDLLPTICDLLDLPLPDRPLEDISMQPLIDGEMTERPRPIAFWQYNTSQLLDRRPQPYIDPELQEGTTPLVKLMGGRFTRNFRNYHHPGKITEQDFEGARVVLDNRYKLVIGAQPQPRIELFDLCNDPAEENNLMEAKPEIAQDLKRQLRGWQQSVLNSLTGADYLRQ